MSAAAAPHPRFHYGWITVGLAALAMVGTLPGRTQGLGLVTEPLLADLHLDRVAFARMNFWATLLGSLFCLGTGRLVDQLGARLVLTAVAFALGAVVLGMSHAAAPAVLFALLVLARGFGQNALSIVSLTMPGHWFSRRLSRAMAAYSIALSIGFMAAFPVVGSIVQTEGWRVAWAGIGWALLLVLVPLGWLLVRPAPTPAELQQTGERDPAPDAATPASAVTAPAASSFTWREAVSSPAFWVFALASSLYNLLASGIGLFNESILAERGFDASIYHRSLVITALTSLGGNFLGGWLATRWPLHRLMAAALFLLSAALVTLPSLSARWQVDVFAAVMGLAGGVIIVLFFTLWPALFGRTHLGRIQGTAQMLTVLASAVGPLLLAQCHALTGSYATIFYLLAALITVLAFVAVRLRPLSVQP